MKTFAIATLVIATAAFSFTSVAARADGFKIPPIGQKVDPGFKTPKGPLQVGQINPGVFKNPKSPGPKFKLPPMSGGPAPAPAPGPKGGMSNGDALALGLGLATVGVIAAAAASQHSAYDDECWYEKQLRYKKSGKAYFKKVLVCE
ncbi:hypothetical protein [Rhizobium sp. C4]|uniref:hypothetical protein n=1 Tax=Rhizobium sp. C4 TaxID=1349800 RepID=UPI001E3AB9D7|nr:hypothetical protein [Rhizobium sp. C4]MCD2175593.1 hypothetical protein [Rhizobium sp. C4]